MIAENDLRAQLDERLRFETLIADLSSKFVNLPAGEVDREIEDTQRRIFEALGIDLCALWQWTPAAPRYITITHLYRPLGGPPPPERIGAEDFAPWCLRQASAGRIVAVDSLDSLLPEAARDQEVWRHYGVKSALNFPLFAGGQFFGALTFNTAREERAWSKDLVNVFPLRVPPLRERTEDIPPLVWAFLEEFCSRMSGDTLRVPMLSEETFAVQPAQTLAEAEREHIRKSLEVELERGRLRSRGAEVLPERAHALLTILQAGPNDGSTRTKGMASPRLNRFLSAKDFPLTSEQYRASMETDVLDQCAWTTSARPSTSSGLRDCL